MIKFEIFLPKSILAIVLDDALIYSETFQIMFVASVF